MPLFIRPAATGSPARFHSGKPSSRRRALEATPAELAYGVVGVHAVGARGSRRRRRRPCGRALRWRRSSPIGTERAPVMWPAPYSAGGRTSSTTTVPCRAGRPARRGRRPRCRRGRRGRRRRASRARRRAPRRRRVPRPQLADPVARQRVVDAGPVAAGGEQARPGQGPEVVGGVGDALVDLAGDLLDRALALGEDIDDLGSPAAGQRLGHLGEAFEQRVLRGPVTHDTHPDAPAGLSCQSSNEYLTM